MKELSLQYVKDSISNCISHVAGLLPSELTSLGITISLQHEAQFGDITTNAALILAKSLRKAPLHIAHDIQKALEESELKHKDLIQKVTIAGPGFLNITLTSRFFHCLTERFAHSFEDSIHEEYKPAQQRYLLEFVSANPTGPLHLGHGRNAIHGDTLQRVLRFLKNKVDSEFYINDAGSQMEKLGKSLLIRCKQILGVACDMPEDGYHGEYLTDLAQMCIAQEGPAAIEKDISFLTHYAYTMLLKQQQQTLTAYRVTIDSWFSEQSLHDSGAVKEGIERLKEAGALYEKEGAWWFTAKRYGDDKDRVLIKQDGSLTYMAADIAYHITKYERGYDFLIGILGQDHHGYLKRLKGTMTALGYDAEKIRILLQQLVSIKKGSIPIKMSKRAGTFTSIDDVMEAIGVDAARFMFLHKKVESHLELDIEKALQKNMDNPLYYLQYAYVRTQSVLAKAFTTSLPSSTSEEYLPNEQEKTLIKWLYMLPVTLKTIESTLEAHLLAQYGLDLAQAFHTFYTNNKILIQEDPTTMKARLTLVKAAAHTLHCVHLLLGITPHQEM